MLAGQSPRGTSARNYEYLPQKYLKDAICEVHVFFDELAKHTRVHLRDTYDTRAGDQLAA